MPTLGPRGGSRPLGRAGTRVPPSGKTGKVYPVIGNQPPPGTCCVQHSFLVPGEGGLLGRVLRRLPRSPRQAVQIPCRHSNRKKQRGPIQGDRKKKYSRRPPCRHTPTSIPSLWVPQSSFSLGALAPSNNHSVVGVASNNTRKDLLNASLKQLSNARKNVKNNVLATKLHEFEDRSSNRRNGEGGGGPRGSPRHTRSQTPTLLPYPTGTAPIVDAATSTQTSPTAT